jgi:ABC-type transport system involved in multi-copper enzyme maturation permease subunit
LLVGPVFTREAVVAPRRIRHYFMRTVYATALLLLICTSWLILKETQVIQNMGDMARFGGTLFQVLAPLQLFLMMFLAAIAAASNIAVEKDRQTLILLLMSRLSNSELVLGKLFASLLNVMTMLMASLPIFMLIVLFGGISFEQVGWSFSVTLTTAFATGSLGALFGFWREKTFQTLALLGIAIVFWLGMCEAIALSTVSFGGLLADDLAGALSPFRAIVAASLPTVTQTWSVSVMPYLLVSGALGSLFCTIAIWKVRRWNPSRELRPQQTTEFSDQQDVITDNAFEKTVTLKDPPTFKDNRVAAQLPEASASTTTRKTKSRQVWSNPILWRETCTWAYGKKIVFIRAVYWMLAIAVFISLYSLVSSGLATRTTLDEGIQIHVATRPLAPFILLSIVMVNALAVTSITTERDGKALDLLRVSDISPKEFLLGKVFGVLIVAGDMVLMPVVLSAYLWISGVISGENFLYLVFSLLNVYMFVAVLGIHCGMLYAGSRQAILISLGTVFFLFLGVITCMVMMISFSGNVEAQLTPFLACIVGGAIGLYLALGWNMPPSPALVFACGVLPFAMFHSITSYLLGSFLTVFVVLNLAYGFATTAITVPRLSEFLVASDRVKAGDTE